MVAPAPSLAAELDIGPPITPDGVAVLVRRTRATSRSTRGSGERRMATNAVPNASRARVMTAGVTSPAKVSARARSASGSWVTGTPIDTRKASRRAASNASPVTRGSRPRVIPVASAPSAAPASLPARADNRASVVLSSSVMPPATTRSRADNVSRAEPRPARTT